MPGAGILLNGQGTVEAVSSEAALLLERTPDAICGMALQQVPHNEAEDPGVFNGRLTDHVSGDTLAVSGVALEVNGGGRVVLLRAPVGAHAGRAFLTSVYSHLPDPHFVFDASRRLLDGNEAAVRLFGADIAAVAGDFERFAVCGENEGERFDAHLGRALERGVCRFNWHWRDAAGNSVPTDVSLVRVAASGSSGEVFVLAAVHDLRRVQRLESRLRHIINASPVGVCLVHDGVIREMNPHMGTLTALHAGDRFEQVFTSKTDRRHVETLLKNGEHVTEFELAVHGPGASVRQVMLSALPVDWDGEAGVLYWLVDVSALKETQQDLVRAKEKAEEATRAKSSFLTRMSHEIRTPMNAILGMSFLIRQAGLSAQQVEHMDKIQAAANELMELINNLLEFSILESGQTEVLRAPFVLGILLEDALSTLQDRAVHKGLAWNLRIAPDVPPRLVGDAPRLEQIISVLASNAFKFTETGSVSVEISRESSSGDEVWLHFCVRDTGIGMSPDQLEQIFQSFTQVDGSLTRKYGGTGLGLSIARHVMGVLGGRMWAESVAGEGSAFHCVLPFSLGTDVPETGKLGEALRAETARVDPVPASGENPEDKAPAAQVAPARVLLVEDNEINQEIACELLREMHLEVDVAENGAEALEAIKAKRFDMIFMDIQMPVLDGLEATRRIRAGEQEWAREVPIIAMTAHALSDDREQSLSAGMNAHLTKPINPEALQRVIAIWLPDATFTPLELAQPQQQEDTTGMETGLDLSSLHGINITSGISNVAGNERLYLDLLRRFAAKYRNSNEELPALLAAYETESAARLAHTIKGVAANLGANKLANQAKDIETAILAGSPITELLTPYAADLEKVTRSIDQLIASRDAMQETHEQKKGSLKASDIPYIEHELEGLPLLMQTDWGQAQERVDDIGKILESTELADLFGRLRNALEEFDVSDFTNTAIELKQRVLRSK